MRINCSDLSQSLPDRITVMAEWKRHVKCAVQTQSEFSEYPSHQHCWLLGVMHMIFSFFSFEEIFQKSALFSCLSSTAKLPPRAGLPVATVWGENQLKNTSSYPK